MHVLNPTHIKLTHNLNYKVIIVSHISTWSIALAIITLLLLSYQVEAGTKLFPAVFVKPTTSNMFQFELGHKKVEKLCTFYPVKQH